MKKKLDLFKSRNLRDQGIQQSLNTAEIHSEKWGTKAYHFLLEYIKSNKEFMAEDVRVASDGIVPPPISKRAWGSIMVLAKKNNIIYSKGYSCVYDIIFFCQDHDSSPCSFTYWWRNNSIRCNPNILCHKFFIWLNIF